MPGVRLLNHFLPVGWTLCDVVINLMMVGQSYIFVLYLCEGRENLIGIYLCC